MAIRAALIDMDGTIWVSPVRVADVRRELGLPQDGRPILHQLAELPPEEQARGIQVLRRHEARAVELGSLHPGAYGLLAFLKERGVKCALVTNNSGASTSAVLARCALPFDLVFTRDDGAMKPDPEAFLGPLAKLGVLPAEAVVIGDSHFDLIAAHEAGIGTVILVRPEEWMRPFFPPEASYHEVQDLAEARDLLARWVP
ncbi:HAD-IA family hydrolase [Candidatus Bipolaricaulota bacterium]|nr:HAD-IA family hydrolase [Candidatus Bipolaricaulota bacterium]